MLVVVAPSPLRTARAFGIPGIIIGGIMSSSSSVSIVTPAVTAAATARPPQLPAAARHQKAKRHQPCAVSCSGGKAKHLEKKSAEFSSPVPTNPDPEFNTDNCAAHTRRGALVFLRFAHRLSTRHRRRCESSSGKSFGTLFGTGTPQHRCRLLTRPMFFGKC